MTPLMQKEFRALAMPAGLVLAAVLAGAWGASGYHLPRGLAAIASQVAMTAFIVGTPLIAALSFGDEFHHRTMVLLLSAPVSRARIWLNKLLAVVVALLVLSGIELAILSIVQPREVTLTPAAQFVLMVVCSAPLWTLVTRSTIGGLAFTGMAIGVVEFASNYVSYRLTGAPLQDVVFGRTPALDTVRVAYSLGALWFGWRVFARFQAAGAGFGISAADSRAAGWAFLRPRRGQAIGNLVRKELMLQRPTFLVAAAFVACWLVALFIVRPRASGSAVADVLPRVILLGQMLLVVVFAGTIPTGEDTSLGIRPWHLTLPVSVRRQWAVKLGVSLLVGLLLAIVVPALMTAFVDAVSPGRFGGGPFRDPPFILLVVCGVVVGFWASTLVGDTVKAAVATGATVLALGWCAMLATLWGDPAHNPAWLVRLVTHLYLPRQLMEGAVPFGVSLTLTIISITALWQSALTYGRARISTATALRLVIVLLAVTFVTVFCVNSVLNALEVAARNTLPVLNHVR